MLRWSLVTVSICTLAFALIARAADPVTLKKPADKAKPMGELTPDQIQLQQRESEIKQEQLKRQFDDFKQSLVRLAQRLESSTKQEDKDKAAILKKAIMMASEQGVDAKFTTLITELKRGDTFKDLDKLQELITKNSDLRNDIRSMIELLLKDDRDAALREERLRTEKMLEKLKELIGKEERMRAAVDQGRKDAESLKRDQEKVTKETRELIDPSKKGDTKKGEAKNAGESKNYGKAEAKYDTKETKGDSRNKEGSESKEGKPSEAKGNEGKEGTESKEGKPSDSKEGKGGDNKEAKPGDSKENKEGKGGDAKEGKGGESKEGKPSDSKEGKGGDSKEGKPGDSKEGKGGEGKEGKPGDSKEGKGDGKGGEAKEGKPGEGKEGKPGDSKEGKPGDSKENKGGQGKPSDSKPGEGSKSGQPKPGEGKGGEAKSGEGKTGEGKDSQGSPSKPGQSSESKGKGEGKGQGKGGESKPSEGGESGKGGESKPSQGGQGGQGGQGKPSGSPPPSGQQPPAENNPAKKQIKDSNKYQESAEKNIEDKKNPDASKDLDKAIEKLEQAKKQLEDLLKQLREEEIERLLAALQGRCERMLALQIGVRDNTVNINDKVKDKKLTPEERRAAEQEANIQSDKEDEIVQEANTAIRLIEAEGSAIAFAEVFKQVRGDMVNVSGRLRKTDVGTVTITVENDIISTLQEMVDALKQARKDNQSPPMPPGPPGQQGPPPDQKLIDQIAELKMIRSMQEKVNKRTTIYGKEYSGEQAPAPGQAKTEAEREQNAMIQRELKELATRQEKIGKVTDDISKGKNKAN